jgi:hypothetical protein
MPKGVEVVVEPYEDELTDLVARWRDALPLNERVRQCLGGLDPSDVRVFRPELPAVLDSRSYAGPEQSRSAGLLLCPLNNCALAIHADGARA